MPLAAFPKCFMDALCVDRSMSVEEWIDLAAAQLDVDGLEFYIGFVPADEPARMAALRARMASHGLRAPMMCYSPDFTKPDPADRAEEVSRQKRAIEAAAALGASYCRVLSGQRRPGVTISEGVEYAAECIRDCLPHAEGHGIVLNLENHYKDSFWDYPELAQSREAFLQLLEAVGRSPNFGVNYDPSNAIVAGDDPIALLEAVKDRVVTMHASDRFLVPGATLEDLRAWDAEARKGYADIFLHGIVGQGINDYDQIFAILNGVGFTGWISIEDGQDSESGMEHLRLSAQFLRAKMAEHGLT